MPIHGFLFINSALESRKEKLEKFMKPALCNLES